MRTMCIYTYVYIYICVYIYLVLLRVCVRQDCIRAHKVSVPVETIRYVRMRQHAR